MNTEKLLDEITQNIKDKDFVTAKKKALDFVEKFPEYKEGFMNLGFASLKTDDLETARQAFNTSIMIDKEDIYSYFHLGMVELESGDLDRSQIYFDKVLTLAPNNIDALTMLALTELRAKRYLMSIHYYKQIFELGEKTVEHISNCADAYIAVEKFDEALDFINQSEKEVPNSSIALYDHKLKIMLSKEMETEAVRYLNQLIEQYPNIPDIYIRYVSILSRFDMHTNTITLLNTALNLPKVSKEQKKTIYIFLSEAYAKSDQKEEAINAYHELIKIAPNNYHFLASRAELYVALKDFKAAIKDYQQAIKAAPKDFNLKIKYADILIKAKRYPQATTLLETALKEAPKDDTIHLFLGKIKLKEKKSKEALLALKKAEEFGSKEASDLLEAYFGKKMDGFHTSIKSKVAQKYEKHPAINKKSAFLADYFGKVFRLDVNQTQVVLKDELADLDENIQEAIWTSLLEYTFIVTEEAIYFDKGIMTPISIGYYSIELESPAGVMLNFQPTKGGASFKVRILKALGTTIGITFPMGTKDSSAVYLSSVDEPSTEDIAFIKARSKAVSALLPSSLESCISEL